MHCYVKEDALACDLISMCADRMVEPIEGSPVLVFLMLLTLRAPVFFKVCQLLLHPVLTLPASMGVSP